MRNLYRKTLIWSPVAIKGALWIFIAMGEKTVELLRNVSPDEFYEFTPKEQWTMILSVMVTGAIAARLFLDQSFGEHQRKIKDEENAHSDSAGAPVA